MSCRALLFAAFCVSCNISHADTPPDLENLSKSRDWHLLIHYDNSIFGGSSSVIDKAFFLSADGKTNPLAELKATYEAVTKKNEAVICNYPARTEWLIRALHLPIHDALAKCTDLNSWKKGLDAEGVSLVMPSSSIDSSLAVFSHTFLKIRSRKFAPDSTLHTAVSYAASFHANSTIVELAFRGIFGGYEGHFGTPGYYGEIAHYGYADAREIFEYRLNLTPKEVDQILNHIWEIKTYGIRYYFLTGNCSYYVLTLIDIARPGLNISDRFHEIVLPADTVQEVFWNSNLVDAVDFVASKETKRVRTLQSLTPNELKSYRILTKQPEKFSEVWPTLPPLTKIEQSKVLDAFKLFLGREKATELDEVRQSVSQTRAELGIKSQLLDWTPLSSPPHLGHHSHVISIGEGMENQKLYELLRFRLVEHDLLNNPIGHDKFSDVQAFDIQLMLKNSELAFRKLSIFSFKALRPIDSEIQKPSSLFRSEFERRIVNHDFSMPFLNSYGQGYSIANDSWLSYLYVNLDSMLDPQLQRGYQLGIGAVLGVRYQLGSDLTALGQLWETRYFLGQTNYNLDAHFSLSIHPWKEWELRATADSKANLSDYLISALHFF